MQLLYNGADITQEAGVTGCVCHEEAGGTCDYMEVTVDDARKWYFWQPQTDDRMEAALGAYRTGPMYLHTMQNIDGRMTLIAASMPAAARRTGSGCYADVSLDDLLRLCAAECGMDSALYGADGEIRYALLRRLKESAPAFMSRVLGYEGMAFKTAGGRFAAIDVSAMQQSAAGKTIYLSARQRGVTHTMQEAKKCSALTLKTPYCVCTAIDEGAKIENAVTLTAPPALDAAQGGRWARGMLLMRNRQAETLELDTAFDAAFYAMARIDVESETAMNGKWMVDQATHDLVKKRSRAVMRRCVETIR